MKKQFTTREAASVVGIGRVTLQRWIKSGKLKPPNLVLRNNCVFRFWTAADIERLRKIKAQTYRKGRGRKKKKKMGL